MSTSVNSSKNVDTIDLEIIDNSDEHNFDPLPNPFLLAKKHSYKDAAKLYQTGLQLVRDKSWEDTVLLFEAFRQSRYRRDWNLRSHLLLGYSLLEFERKEEAVKHLAKTTTGFGLISSDIRWLLAETYFSIGQYRNARLQYRKIAKSIARKSNQNFLVAVENPHYYLSELKEVECLIAEKKFKTAIVRARQYLKKYAKDQKLVKIVRTKSIHPFAGELAWQRAIAYRNLGQFNKEITQLKKIRTKFTACSCYDVAAKRIKVLMSEGKSFLPPYGQELISYIKALRRVWLLEEMYQDILNAQKLYTKDKVEAQTEIDSGLLLLKGKVLIDKREYAKGLELFLKIVADRKFDENLQPEALLMLAKSFSRLNKIEQASQTYTEFAAKYPDHKKAEVAEFLSAWLLGHLSQKRTQAILQLELFREKYPKSGLRAKAAWFMAWFAYRNKEYQKAYKLFESLRSEHPRAGYLQASYYWMGRIKQKTGKLGEAKSFYLFLAGENYYSYYRLLAIQRLQELMVMKPARSVPADLRQLALNLVVAKPVGRNEIDNTLKIQENFWENFVEVMYEFKLFSLPAFRESGLKTVQNLGEHANKNKVVRRKFIDKIAQKWRKLFPDLKRFVMLDRLGLEKEAARVLGRFVELNLTMPRKRPKSKPRKMTEAAYTLLISRMDAFKEIKNKLFLHIFNQFLEYQDIPRAFRVLTKKLNGNSGLPENLRNQLEYPFGYRNYVEKYCDAYNVSDDLVYSIVRTESYYKHWVSSNVNASGLMQVMPHTGIKIAARMEDEEFCIAKLYAPDMNINYGVWYLKQLLIKFHGQLPLAIAAYNGGPHNVAIWLERNPDLEWDEFIESIEFSQTRGYVKKVLRSISAYRHLYTGDYSAWDITKPIDYNYENNINW